MIVRESPRKRVEENKNWPPKNPHEALLSSPSGRKKYERERMRNSVSPSPSKRRPLPRTQSEDDDDEEEDEETVQLRLQAIEAKLKLKKLQSKKARQAAEDAEAENARPSSRPSTAASFRRPELARPHSDVQVPVSPTRVRRAPEEPKSPARVILGIDKGLRAQDVSLKRAASYSNRANAAINGTLSRATSRAEETPRGKTFSERIAESRNKEKEREEKQARIEKSRSTGFGLHNIEGLKDGASSRASSSLSTAMRGSQDTAPATRPEPSRTRSIADIRNAASQRPSSNLSTRSEATRTPATLSRGSSYTQSTAPTPSIASKKYEEIARRDESTDAASFESFSSIHLKTRQMPHNTLTRTLEGKTILTIPQMLKTVKAPDFDPPDMENDYVVLGVISSKSAPLNTKSQARDNTTGNQERSADQHGKFMVIHITDLKWELDLFLFDTGFSQFWKLSVGTLIAILNPEIMPPRSRDTGKFSLKLASSDDTVIEIGTARDLDFCHAIKKDGKECGQWVDGRKTEFCDFHIELQVEKSKRGRMEVNTMTGFGKGGKHGMFGGSSGLEKKNSRYLLPHELPREGKHYDSAIHETMYITSGVGAAKLLDGEKSWERGASREEMHRKRLAEKEKERELAKKLGASGVGAGGDYMKVKGANTPNLPARGDANFDDPFNTSRDADTGPKDPLGILGKKADDVSLAPAKRKRMVSGKSTHSEPIGWGGASRRPALFSPPKTDFPSAMRDTREPSPAKKKARLLLPEKGIREPGRESLGGMDVGLIAAMDDDDDDLEIV